MVISIREESNLPVRTGVGEGNLYSFQFSSFGSEPLGIKILGDRNHIYTEKSPTLNTLVGVVYETGLYYIFFKYCQVSNFNFSLFEPHYCLNDKAKDNIH